MITAGTCECDWMHSFNHETSARGRTMWIHPPGLAGLQVQRRARQCTQALRRLGDALLGGQLAGDALSLGIPRLWIS